MERIKHLGDVEYYNLEIHVLVTRVDNISESNLLEYYIGGLKEDIKYDIFLKDIENFMEVVQSIHHIQSKNR
jgi:hypothetical protein